MQDEGGAFLLSSRGGANERTSKDDHSLGMKEDLDGKETVLAVEETRDGNN